MNLKEVKALGAPFPAAEVQVSVRKRVARLICITPDRTNPSIAFDLDESEDFEIAVAATLEAARDASCSSWTRRCRSEFDYRCRAASQEKSRLGHVSKLAAGKL